ncbi:MAG: hypothetical protein F6K16_33935 [Symploca sp. SIO2B6]|nr:hypothetical protein [Symploca sp. SIO2B6]
MIPHVDNPKPKDSTFIRLCLSQDGCVLGACYHYPLSWLVRLLQFIGLMPKGGQVIDFESELSDGSFVVTSNCLEMETTADIPNIHRHLFLHNTSALELLNHHKQTLKEFHSQGIIPVPMYSYEDMEAAQHRLQAIKNGYRASVGFVMDEDIDNAAGKHYREEAEILKQALKEIQFEN